jgi:hypothetical protein
VLAARADAGPSAASTANPASKMLAAEARNFAAIRCQRRRTCTSDSRSASKHASTYSAGSSRICASRGANFRSTIVRPAFQLAIVFRCAPSSRPRPYQLEPYFARTRSRSSTLVSSFMGRHSHAS